MVNLFDRISAAATKRLAAVFPETITFRAVTQPPNGRPVTDQTRPTRVDVKVMISRPEERKASHFDVPRSDDKPRAVRYGHRATLYVSREALGYAPLANDEVTITSLEGEPVYKVEMVNPDGPDRFACPMILIAGTP